MDYHVWLFPIMQGNIKSGPHDWMAISSEFICILSLEKNVYLGHFPILKSEHGAFGVDLYELQEVSKNWLE